MGYLITVWAATALFVCMLCWPKFNAASTICGCIAVAQLSYFSYNYIRKLK